MRKIAKLKFRDDDAKFRRSPIQARFRSGSESYTPQSYVNYGSRCTPSTVSEVPATCSGSFQFPRNMGGTEVPCQDEEMSIDHMSEEVVQVVEELMEQTCILKKRFVEMVSALHQKVCRCPAHGPAIAATVTSGCSCKPSSNKTCPPEMSNRRFSAGRASYDSSGYESCQRKEAIPEEPPSHEVEGFNECLCTAQDRCYTASAKDGCSTREPRRSCFANSTDHPDKTRKPQRFSNVSNYLTEELDRAQAGALRKSQRVSDVSHYFTNDSDRAHTNALRKSQRVSDVSHYFTDDTEQAHTDALRKSQRVSDGSKYITDDLDRAQAGAVSPTDDVNIETQAEMSKKLADAQKQIDNLRCLIKKFVTCNCSKNSHRKDGDKTQNHLINQADSIQAMLAGIRCECKSRPPASNRIRSGAEHGYPVPEINSSKEITTAEDATKDGDRKPQNNARKPEEHDIGEPANSDNKVDSSIREVNTIKQNDVVYAPDGRVIKTIAKLKRTEIVEGKNPPSTDTTIPEPESKVKTAVVKVTGDKQGNKNITNTNHLHKTDPSKYLSRKGSVEAITCSESSETLIEKRRKGLEQRSHTTEKQHKPRHQKGFRASSTCKPKKKSTRKKNYSSDSIASTSTGEGQRVSHGVAAGHRIRKLFIPPRNNDEYIIREYIYPRDGKKRRASLSAGAEAYPHVQLPTSHDGKIDSHTVSLLGCKFFNKMHQPPSTLNLGGKADSYFIEIQPKKSHSFHGISSRHDFPQKRTSTMNYAEMYKREDVGRATASSYFQETRAGGPKAAEESFSHGQTFYPHKSSARQHDMTEAAANSSKPKETAKSSVGQAPMDVSVKGVSINQIPYIIKQLGGKRTAKDFFVSVLPVKRPHKNFRVNVIDKDSGNLLGYFFVDEEVFHQARSKGVFDSYLSLFVLNSLASFTDFMSLKKKDPNASGGLRVAANDPHLVSLGGGRLSTVVTIHYIPIGNTTIGSSASCSVSLNGSGVRSLHCTVKRNDQDEITIVPEVDARVLIDGNKIAAEAKLTQGAMLTIGNSNYLRFNNPAEAQLIRSTMGSNERISMPQIDFTQDSSGGSNRATPEQVLKNFNSFLESQNIDSHKQNNATVSNKAAKIEYLNINNLLSPKVFTADSITVNAPAKDVLGPKYANFAKNLAENHKKEKNLSTKTNNEMNLKTSSNYVNIPTGFIQNSSNPSTQLSSSSSSSSTTSSNHSSANMHFNTTNEVLTKVNNNSSTRNYCHLSSTYDRYPKPGSYGGLQIFPMNGVNSDINTCSAPVDIPNNHARNHQAISPQEQERVDEILKMCAEFEKQNQTPTNTHQSSPIVQNRIKTNGSLPRDKKSPFYDIGSQSSKTFFPDKSTSKYTSSGYENVRLVGDRRVEIGGATLPAKSSSGYENVTLSTKYMPQSPRTKIRTTCTSPKRDIHTNPFVTHHPNSDQAKEYANLIQSFEDKLKFEMEAMRNEENLNGKKTTSPEATRKRQNRNINNLTIDLSSTLEDNKDKEILDELKLKREAVLDKIRRLKTQIAEVQRQEDEVIREMDMEKALVTAEMNTVNSNLVEMEKTFVSLQGKIHRLEAQRNANRVMQETQQAKLKQNIEMKQEQVSRMENLLEKNRSDTSLKEDLEKTRESLENDRKTFEDMEFQYLEEETEWLAYREELHNELKSISKQIDDKRLQMLRLENEGVENQNSACTDTKTLESSLLVLLTTLEKSRAELQSIDKYIFEISGQQQSQSDSDDDGLMNYQDRQSHPISNMMSQSLFGSTEILSAKPKDIDMMSRSVNENMFFNNIEMPSFSRCGGGSTSSTNINGTISSTPKKELKIFKIHDDIDTNTEDINGEIIPKIVRRESNEENDPLLKLKYNVEHNSSPTPPPSSADEVKAKVNLNLSLGSDDFEVNPLDKRVASQDDIDRICKVTLDAPISTTKGASSKIIESIKEIERNRQLLLAQQGTHVIEHERQKMLELKKKSHDEARMQYMQSQTSVTSTGVIETLESDSSDGKSGKNVKVNGDHQRDSCDARDKLTDTPTEDDEDTADSEWLKKKDKHKHAEEDKSSQQRHSNPEYESQLSRPLSEANSDISYDLLSDKPYKSSNDIGSNYLCDNNNDDGKRSSINSTDTSDNDRLVSGSRRNLPKHQRPLTRYLPIFSPDLDLRQHIESAGHQISLCPHVIVDSTSCRGYLHKLGATFHGWSRRWFVLDRQKNAFIYYSDKSERKPRGGAYFSTIDEVYLDHLNTSKSGRPHCTFIVKTKKRSYHLQAASDAAARIWIDAIITGAQGNIDY